MNKGIYLLAHLNKYLLNCQFTNHKSMTWKNTFSWRRHFMYSWDPESLLSCSLFSYISSSRSFFLEVNSIKLLIILYIEHQRSSLCLKAVRESFMKYPPEIKNEWSFWPWWCLWPAEGLWLPPRSESSPVKAAQWTLSRASTG